MSERVLVSTLAYSQSRLRRPDIFPVLFSTLALAKAASGVRISFRYYSVLWPLAKAAFSVRISFRYLGVEGTPEFNPQAEFISAEENPVFLRPDKVQGFPQK